MDYGNLKVPENVTPEVQAILDRYEARNKEIENAHRKNTGRIWLGSALSGASAHPVFNIPYIGTGLGGALYELGQGITEGDKLPELAKRTGAGFAIGETVGAIPYAGKYANKLSGGKIGNALTAGVEKIASRPLGQKVTEIAPKVEDLLMTDIKAFNPNRQTVYHGSPYDFAKFSNEAIGTGEGAQAHGYGHYTALDKDVAQGYADRLSEGKVLENVKINGREIEKDPFFGYHYKDTKERVTGGNGLTLETAIKILSKNKGNLEKTIKSVQNDAENYFAPEIIDHLKKLNIEIAPNSKQLYKLSIPKDDVMLREDLPINQQPLLQEVFKNEQDRLAKKLSDNFLTFKFFTNNKGLDIEDVYKTKYWNEAQTKFSRNPELYIENYYPSSITGKQLYDDLTHNTNRKQAAQYLHDKGIKGISYNGGIDGEARVIFNPDDIEIVRKYYNQPSLGEMLLKKSPNAGATSNYLYDLMIRE